MLCPSSCFHCYQKKKVWPCRTVSVTADFCSLGVLSPAGVWGLSEWCQASDAHHHDYGCDLMPPWISQNRHQAASPVGMSRTSFFPCFCLWPLQPSVDCEKLHIGGQPLYRLPSHSQAPSTMATLRLLASVSEAVFWKVLCPTCLTWHWSLLLTLKASSALVTCPGARPPSTAAAPYF